MRSLIFFSLLVCCASQKFTADEIAKATDLLNKWLDKKPTTVSAVPLNRFGSDEATSAPTPSPTPAPTPSPTTESNTQKKFTIGAPCKTDDNQDGFCVKLTQCTKKAAIKDPTAFTLREKETCHYLTPCCPANQTTIAPVIIPQKPIAGCGWSNPGANSFRDKSNEPICKGCAYFGDFPWMVALLKVSENTQWENSYIGGGGLIHPSVVVTVAHKVDEIEKDQLRCRAGEFDTRTTNELYPFQERSVKKVIIHDEYIRLHARNDIGLLILTTPFELVDAPNLGIGCVGTRLPALDSTCFSMGWGQDFNDNNKYAVILKKISLPLVEAKTCERNLQNTKLGSDYVLHSSLTCAGGEEGIDTCVGDGGSTLVCEVDKKDGNKRYVIYGLVAYGVSCGKKDEPGVYVNVPEFYDWIGEKMAAEKLDKSSYILA